MPTVHIPDELVFKIIRLGKKEYPDYKQFIRDAIKEKIEREEEK